MKYKQGLFFAILFVLFFSSVSLAQWLPPINLGPNINTNMEDKGPDISHDGKRLYFWSLSSGYDLFISDWDSINGQWRPRTNLGTEINTRYNEIGPCISADGRRLYFASDRPG